MQEFRGKTAVVTGAGSGIGRALASASPPRGCGWPWPTSTATTSRRRPSWPERRVPVVRGDGPGLRRERCRIGRTQLADSVFDRWGQVDVLCNNAGVFVGGFIWDRPAADFEFVLGVNLWGILNGIRAFVPRMIAQGTEGHVVNTASVAGLLGAPFEAPYAISKFAAFAATESLAHDLAGGRVEHQGLGAVPGHDHHQHRRLRPAPARRVWPPSSPRTRSSSPTIWPKRWPRGWTRPRWPASSSPAIRAEHFLILTHDAYPAQLRERLQALLARRLPDVPDFA